MVVIHLCRETWCDLDIDCIHPFQRWLSMIVVGSTRPSGYVQNDYDCMYIYDSHLHVAIVSSTVQTFRTTGRRRLQLRAHTTARYLGMGVVTIPLLPCMSSGAPVSVLGMSRDDFTMAH